MEHSSDTRIALLEKSDEATKERLDKIEGRIWQIVAAVILGVLGMLFKMFGGV